MFTTHTIRRMLENDKFKMDKNLLRDYMQWKKGIMDIDYISLQG